MPFTLTYAELPLTDDPRQVFTTDVSIDGTPFHAKVEIRYLSAPNRWVVSLWDNASATLLVPGVPLVCSYGNLNDLLFPFRHLREGKGAGSMFLLRNKKGPSADDPAEGTLKDYMLLYGDTLRPEE